MDDTEQAFPMLKKDPWGAYYHFGGMTYRQWLIGQSIVGVIGDPELNNNSCSRYAEKAISLVDSIIAKLEQEKADEKKYADVIGGGS
jgi:hypothetical protein